jgi:hypothetical protein
MSLFTLAAAMSIRCHTGNWPYQLRKYDVFDVAVAYFHQFLVLIMPWLWIKPLGRDLFVNDSTMYVAYVGRDCDHSTASSFFHFFCLDCCCVVCHSSFSDEFFDSMRLAVIVLAVVLRIVLFRPALQSFLDQSLFFVTAMEGTKHSTTAHAEFVRGILNKLPNRKLSAALQWIGPLLMLIGPLLLLLQSTDLGLCDYVFGPLQCPGNY